MMQTLIEGAQRLNFGLTQEQIRQFQDYCQKLMAEAPSVGLTAVIDPEGIQRRHFLESLALLAVLKQKGAIGEKAIDIGSGAGFPGLPFKIVEGQLALTLVESSRKKAAFLERLVQDLGLSDVQVVCVRAEELAHNPGYRECYDLALARALAPLPTLVELALPFLCLGGHLAAPKGSRALQEVEVATTALALCGGQVEETQRLDVPGVRVAPILVLIRKVAPTPSRFPRRPGIPAKRPLR